MVLLSTLMINMYIYLNMPLSLTERGHVVFSADPVGIGVGVTLFCLHINLVNQWLKSYQIFMDI